MTVQRYVYQYLPYETVQTFLAWFNADHQAWRRERDPLFDPHKAAQDAYEHHMATYGHMPFEKEGGGFTTELSEAKLIGWRSAKKWSPVRGTLIPARIVLETESPQ